MHLPAPADKPCFIGIDVSKASCSWFNLTSGESGVCLNQRSALKRWLKQQQKKYPQLYVVCEATGGYESVLLDVLLNAQIRVHRADARKVKAFIRSWGRLAKTDGLDAKALACYAAERYLSLPCYQPPSQLQSHLKALMGRRKDLLDIRVQEKNRLKAPGHTLPERVKKSQQTLLAVLNEEIEAIDAEIEALQAENVDFSRQLETLTQVVGVGRQSALALLCYLPELGQLSGRQVASLAGLAPHPKQSGQKNGYRKTGGGRPAVRSALFMAAMSARMHHPQLKQVYQRLLENGKKPMVALIALARKLLVILNAKLRDLSLQPLSI